MFAFKKKFEYRIGQSAKRIALKIGFPAFLSKGFALCAMRYAIFPAENTARQKNSHLWIENYFGSRYSASVPLRAIFFIPMGLSRLISAVSFPSSPVTSIM